MLLTDWLLKNYREVEELLQYTERHLRNGTLTNYITCVIITREGKVITKHTVRHTEQGVISDEASS